MSGEFRETYGSFMHNALDLCEEPGEQELSKLLFTLYKALQPLERTCAYVEAGDSSPTDVILATIKHGDAVTTATRALEKYIRNQKELADRLIRGAVRTEQNRGEKHE